MSGQAQGAHLCLFCMVEAARPVDDSVRGLVVQFHSAADRAAGVELAVVVDAGEHWAVITDVEFFALLGPVILQDPCSVSTVL